MYLEVENLNVNLGEFHLKDISLEIERGEYVVLIGPTGSGKSVLLETIIGFYQPDSGIIKLDGKILNDVAPEERNIGIVYQDHVLFPNMNVYDNIAYGLKRDKSLTKEEIDEKVKSIAEKMNISHILHRDVLTLSGGESQRTALARAIIVGPDIILMDEPFSALDVTTQAKLTSLIKDIGVEYKTTFLHVTHNFNDVWNLADKVGVMKNGVLHQLDYIYKVFSKPANDFVASFVGVNNIFDGKIVNTKQNSVTVKLNDNIQIQSTDDEYCNLASHEVIGENVLVAIRPENIIFAKSTFESSARNQLKGKITKIEESGPIVNVETDVEGILFKGILTRNSFENLDLKLNGEVYLIFKSVNVNVLDSYNTFKLS
ncbi:ATP-binding cassette domain-containing protein [uncultured Methanobrevibacter sp.]|uniref:ATP-binding cassette domain-containing protein n=1 Tax=uncultured Methanobrevibacter sp. TaxID=253161 RepID=UPI0026239D98|nr:ATP-binding cassette domain-containing protein [uncultured Methanobrevibacter sp.]